MATNQLKPHKTAFILPTIIILIFLGLQLYTAGYLRDFWSKFRRLQPAYKLLKPPEKPVFWPFIDYPMYSYPKYLKDDIKQYVIYGILPDSSEVLIQPEDLGINYWIFMYGLKDSLRNNNVKDVKYFAKIYESRNYKKLVGIRLENHPLILTEKGINPGKVEVVNEIQLSERQE